MGELNYMSTCKNVGRVRGHLSDGYDEYVSSGDLMEDRKHTQLYHTAISLNVYISQLWGLHLILV